MTDTNDDVTVYNMRIEEYHTYFVGSAEWGFSVQRHIMQNMVCLEASLTRTGAPKDVFDQVAEIKAAKQKGNSLKRPRNRRTLPSTGLMISVASPPRR